MILAKNYYIDAHYGFQQNFLDGYMVKLGSEKRPVILRVQNEYRIEEMARICSENGWHFIIGIEPDEPEDISDLEKLLNPPKPIVLTHSRIKRNDSCYCGSGKKYKKCCLE